MSDALKGMNILLQGASGAGKTTSIRTLLDIPDIEVFAIFTDPRYDVLGKQVLDKIHYAYLSPATSDWDTMKRSARVINTMSNDSLQKVQGVEASKFTQYVDLLDLCNNFVDQHGEEFGDILDWGTNRVFILDNLTGLSKMSRTLRVGSKSVLSQPDWGVAMSLVQQFVDILTMETTCHLVLMSHIEREQDEIDGGTRIMVSTLGRKLAPTIPPNFGDVILAKREGTNFFWDTIDTRADLKSAFAGFGGKLPASFFPLFQNWVKAGGVYQD